MRTENLSEEKEGMVEKLGEMRKERERIKGDDKDREKRERDKM